MTIYVLSPDNNKPSGGIKILYRHVDVLNQNDIDSVLLHQNPDFRCTWFDNDTRIDYLGNVQLNVNDYLVVPEIFGPNISRLSQSPNIGDRTRKIIFNQNCRYTFLGQTLDTVTNPDFDLVYKHTNEFVGAIVVSEDSKRYLEYVFPEMPVWRIHNAINIDKFRYSPDKKPQICFMPRKNEGEALQVIGVLKLRDALRDFSIVPIQNTSEAGVAEIMSESAFFLSFGYPEGCPLPPAEAMASGCVVIGYDGFGGKEYFKEEFCCPIPVGDITGFAEAVENQINLWYSEPEQIRDMAKKASKYILETYSSEVEQQDIVAIWKSILKA